MNECARTPAGQMGCERYSRALTCEGYIARLIRWPNRTRRTVRPDRASGPKHSQKSDQFEFYPRERAPRGAGSETARLLPSGTFTGLAFTSR